MKRKRQWVRVPPKPAKQKVSPEFMRMVDKAVTTCIETTLKPRYFSEKPFDEARRLVNIYAKWHQQHFVHFLAEFHDTRPNVIQEHYSDPFARMAYMGDERFNLAYMRHTGQWWDKYQNIPLKDCLDAIKNDDFFMIHV
ncbi:MAG: hypothetical protein IPP74_08660 [Alphaproteobacteria bacterium]|nr:hypothetical protein [Alphaproteobacteria bacterium]